MKIAFSAVVFFLAQAASAAAYIDASSDAQMYPSQVDPKLIRLVITGESADQIFDALKVGAVSNTEDVHVSNKSEPGIYCSSEASAEGRKSSCQIGISTLNGVIGAISKSPMTTEDLTISMHDGAAHDLYKNLAVSASQEDAEGYVLTKTVSGMMCEKHTVNKTHDCVIVFDSAKGILK